MSFDYRIPPSGSPVRIVATGRIRAVDCVRMVSRIVSDPRCKADSEAIVDLRHAVYRPEDLSDVKMIAGAMEDVSAMLKGRIAIVAEKSTILAAEVLSAYLRKAHGIGIRVFADMAAAKVFCSGVRPAPHKA